MQLTSAVLQVCEHVIYTALVLGITWLILRGLGASTTMLEERVARESYDSFQGRRVRTQAVLLKRVVGILLGFVAGAVILLQFEFVRSVGVSLLASAGVLGVVVGVAAQRSLAAIVGGIQFSVAQPVRMADQVVVEGEFGEIEEINLTYVVVRLWDKRRLIVPITYFLEKPFQNWTRTASDLVGAVAIKVDFAMPIDAVRAELRRICEADPLWDKKTCVLQATDSDAASVTLRALVSAADATRLWELRCRVREHLLAFVQAHVGARNAARRPSHAREQAGTNECRSARARNASAGPWRQRRGLLSCSPRCPIRPCDARLSTINTSPWEDASSPSRAGRCPSSTPGSSTSTRRCARPRASSTSATWASSACGASSRRTSSTTSSRTTRRSSSTGRRCTRARATRAARSSTTSSSTAVPRNDWLIVCNASNREKMSAHFARAAKDHCDFEDQSDATALIALQGPRAFEVLAALGPDGVGAREPGVVPLHRHGAVGRAVHGRAHRLHGGGRRRDLLQLERRAGHLAARSMTAGEGVGIKPIGLGARDTLRLEGGCRSTATTSTRRRTRSRRASAGS